MYVIGETSVAIQIKKNLFNQKFPPSRLNTDRKMRGVTSILFFQIIFHWSQNFENLLTYSVQQLHLSCQRRNIATCRKNKAWLNFHFSPQKNRKRKKLLSVRLIVKTKCNCSLIQFTISSEKSQQHTPYQHQCDVWA